MGRPAAPGAAVAPAFVVETQLLPNDVPETASGSPEEELARLLGALDRSQAELRELARTVSSAAGEDEGEIFEAHADFVADPELISLAREAVEAGASAERAVVEALGSFRELLLSSTSEYLAARAADLDDVQDRVVKILVRLSPSADTPNHRSSTGARGPARPPPSSTRVDRMTALATGAGSRTSPGGR